MTNNIQEVVKRDFSFLFEQHGFRVRDHVETGELDQSFVVLTSADFRLRMVTDRGHSNVDIAQLGEDSEWFDLNLVKILNCGGEIMDQLPLPELASFLKQHYIRVRDMFRNGNIVKTVHELKTLQHQRARAMFPQAFD